MQLQIGDIVEGKVTGITKFGAFIRLPDGTTGLVHISEVSGEYVRDINQHLNEQQMVKVKILSMDSNGKVSLSIRRVQESEKPNEPAKTSHKGKVDKDRASKAPLTFEEKLAKFIKDSDEKLLDLKKNVESKRGSGAYKKTAHF